MESHWVQKYLSCTVCAHRIIRLVDKGTAVLAEHGCRPCVVHMVLQQNAGGQSRFVLVEIITRIVCATLAVTWHLGWFMLPSARGESRSSSRKEPEEGACTPGESQEEQHVYRSEAGDAQLQISIIMGSYRFRPPDMLVIAHRRKFVIETCEGMYSTSPFI